MPVTKKGVGKLQPLWYSVAGTTRLELATSGVTGRRSNQSELRPRKQIYDFKESELAIFPPEKRDVLTNLNYVPANKFMTSKNLNLRSSRLKSGTF